MEKQFNNQLPIAANFFVLNDFSKLENGNYGVKGLLTTFDDPAANFNGYVYKSGAYDNFCKNYYQSNGKSIPVDLLHETNAFDHLAGKVTEFISSQNEVRIVAEISRHAVYFNNIVGLIEDGVLQGFSDFSFVNKYNFAENGLMNVEECNIFSVALVQNPAVVKSTLEAMNATKFTFTKKEDETLSKKRNGIFGL